MRAAAVVASSLAVAGAQLTDVESVRPTLGWTKARQVEADRQLDFSIALKHSGSAKQWLRRTVAEVSTPGSAAYGKYLSLAELTAKMAPPAEAVEAVRAALVTAGVRDGSIRVTESGDWMKVSTAAATAEAVFGANFCEWEHRSGHSVVRACGHSYAVPSAIHHHVDFVSGLVHFPTVDGGPTFSATASGDVATLRSAYSIGDVKATSGKSSAAFTQFLGQWYGHKSLTKFLSKYAPDQADQTIARAVGPDQSGSGTEANLDAQYLTAMGHGAPTWVWTNQHKNSVNNQEPWVEFFTNVSSTTALPLLFSISYGEGEDTLTKTYMDRSDTELQKIAARGITMMSASGDNGAGCKSGKFVANFPAALPHITSVGGTSSCGKGSGAAGFSSGGFSDFYPQQSWQADAVKQYLSQSSVPPSKFFNASGRAYPDVAACGSVVICESIACGLGVQGTSCASPIFAGVMALINDARLAAGKPSLGFLNPLLYSNAAAFDDVTSGSTEGCSGGKWSATPGWDPTTGLGTPNYAKLVKAAMQ